MFKKKAGLGISLLVSLLLVACGQAEPAKVLTLSTAAPTTGTTATANPAYDITPAATVPPVAAGNANAKVAVGSAAPDFALRSLDKTDVSLSQYRGKAVLVNFWATWCGPCKQELPLLAKTYEANKDKVEIVGVDVAEEETLVRLKVAEYGMTYTNLLDREHKVSDLYKVYALPTSLFIDKSGVIKVIRPGALDEQTLKPLLDKLTS